MSIRSQEQVALLTDYDPNSAFCLAYQTLYANLRFNWSANQQQPHTLLIAVPVMHTALSAIAANVAIAAAQSGTPTLLVDADLRNPSLAQRFGLGDHHGLRELLSSKGTLTSQQIKEHISDTFIAGLRLLTAGTSTTDDGAAPLLSAQLSTVIDGLRQYMVAAETTPGVIIFNTAAALAGPDASLIAAQVEQTLLTIVRDTTTRIQAKQAQEQLQRAHATLAGIVMLDS